MTSKQEIQSYSALVGSTVRYTNHRGICKSGIFKKIVVAEKDGICLAEVEKGDCSLSPFRSRRERVPLCMIYTNHEIETSRISEQTVFLSSDNIFQHNDKVYEKMESYDRFKISDDVVWMLSGQNWDPDKPLIGKILMIGMEIGAGCLSKLSRTKTVAVVKFDQPTQSLPGYLRDKPYYRNVVSVSELMDLALWSEPVLQPHTKKQEPWKGTFDYNHVHYNASAPTLEEIGS